MKSDQKVKNNSGKIILKKILSKFLPEKLIDRPKMGFGIPLDKIIRENFKDRVENYLFSKSVEDQQIFNLDHYKKIWNEHKAQKRNWQYVLWNFLVFQLWYEKKKILFKKSWYFEKKKISFYN